MVTLVSDHAHEASCKHYCKLAKMRDHSIPICPERTVQPQSLHEALQPHARVLQVCGRYVVHLKAKQRIRLVVQNGLTYSATFKHFD